MKFLNSIKSATAALLLITTVSTLAQAPAEGARGDRGGRGDFGRGGRGGRGFGPQLPAEQQALVDKINSALSAESQAVAAANSNLVAASYLTPKSEAKITEANNALAKAREAWATKAAKLFAETQASDTKLSPEAITVLVESSSGRSGRGGRGGRGGP